MSKVKIKVEGVSIALEGAFHYEHLENGGIVIGIVVKDVDGLMRPPRDKNLAVTNDGLKELRGKKTAGRMVIEVGK